MSTTATQNKKNAETQMPPQDFMAGAWDNALKMQRQMFGVFAQPLGFVPAPEKMMEHWQMLNKECLEQTEKSFVRVKDFVAEEVQIVRDFTDKAMDMTKGDDQDKAPAFKPEVAREWFDTTWRCFERSVDFNKKSMKAAEEFGTKFSELLMKEPIAKK